MSSIYKGGSHQNEPERKQEININNDIDRDNDYILGLHKSNGDDSTSIYSEHPSLDDIMKFVNSNKADIMNNPQNNLKIITHFIQCEECRLTKKRMIALEQERDFALSIGLAGKE